MSKDPIVQAADQHHAEEADHQRRYDRMVEEIYADLPAHLDEIIELTNTERGLKALLLVYINSRDWSSPGNERFAVFSSMKVVIDIAVNKIVERRLEL